MTTTFFFVFFVIIYIVVQILIGTMAPDHDNWHPLTRHFVHLFFTLLTFITRLVISKIVLLDDIATHVIDIIRIFVVIVFVLAI